MKKPHLCDKDDTWAKVRDKVNFNTFQLSVKPNFH